MRQSYFDENPMLYDETHIIYICRLTTEPTWDNKLWLVTALCPSTSANLEFDVFQYSNKQAVSIGHELFVHTSRRPAVDSEQSYPHRLPKAPPF